MHKHTSANSLPKHTLLERWQEVVLYKIKVIHAVYSRDDFLIGPRVSLLLQVSKSKTSPWFLPLKA